MIEVLLIADSNYLKMTLSVICPIYNEEKYIGQFLKSILQQDYPKDDLEILLVDGMSIDRTREIISDYSKKYSCLRLVDNPQQTVPYAMNNGINNAKGEIIIRLDAHAEYPSNYFSVLVKKLEELDGADNVGGVCITLPCNETAVAVAIAAGAPPTGTKCTPPPMRTPPTVTAAINVNGSIF